MKKTIVSCDTCSAECTILFEVEKPFKISFCPFCGEVIEKDLEWGDQWGEFDDEFDDYEEYNE